MYRDAAEVCGVTLDFARMDPGTDLEAIPQRAIADRCRTPDGSCCAVEEGEEAVARRINLHAAKPVQPEPYYLAVSGQQLFPGRISQPNGHFCGVDDVGDEQGRDKALAGIGWFSPAVHAAVFDGHKRFLADHPRVVAGRDLERLAGAKNPPRPSVGFDLNCALKDKPW